MHNLRKSRLLAFAVAFGMLIGLIASMVPAFGVDATSTVAAAEDSAAASELSVQDADSEGSEDATTSPTPQSTTTTTAAPEVTTPTTTPTTAPTSTATASPTPSGTQSTTAAEPDQVTAAPPDSESDLSSSDALITSDDMAITPLLAGPDGSGLTAPYVYWNVQTSTGTKVGGATVTLQGPRAGRTNWGSSISVLDNTGQAGYSGADVDTDPGEFAVMWIGSHRISDSNRYRIRQETPPASYSFTAGADWDTISGNSNSPSSGQWTNRVHGFSSILVGQNGSYAAQCSSGYVYGVSSSGQIQQITPAGVVTNIGSSVSGANSFNGLGIGRGGDPIYGYNRSGNQADNATIYKFNTATGAWASVTSAYDTNLGNGLVTGAVDLNTSVYYFGGFTSDGSEFHLWKLVGTSVQYVGYFPTGSTARAQNGDMAFDSQGNLFVVRGSGNTTTVYSLTASDLGSATGGRITASQSASFDTQENVNGVTFDASGRGYLGTNNTVYSYTMPNWTGSTNAITSGTYSGTDLASCSSPATIEVEKVVNGRVDPSDQFKLTLRQGSTDLGTAETSGASTGVQTQRIGPLPTARGVTLTFSEVMTSGSVSSLSKYAAQWQCTVDGVAISGANGTGSSGTVTIPATGAAVLCQFTNSPLVATVHVNKLIQANDGTTSPRSGWTVGSVASATTGTVSGEPSATTQATNSSGTATWSYTFGAATGRASVVVSEQPSDGYQFVSGQCDITKANGDESTVSLSSVTSAPITGVGPGDVLDCTYVNKASPGTFAIMKAFDNSVPSGSGNSTVFTGDYSCLISGQVVASGTWTRTGTGAATLTPAAGSPAANAIPAGATCSATENQPTGSGGLPNTSYEWDTYSASAAVPISSNQTGTVTVTNKAKRIYGNFSVTKFVPVSSTVDSGMTFTGTWTCSLGNEVKTGTWGQIAAGATWTSTNADAIPLGATCSVATEVRPGSPVAGDPSYVWDGDADLGTPVAAVNTTPLRIITVTNKTTRVLGSVTWTKVDGEGITLSGSEWSVKGPGASGETVAVLDCTGAPCAGPDKDPVAGQFRMENLLWGEYTLTETRAPAGYYPADPVNFTIGEGSLDLTLEPIVNLPINGPDLPLSGGIGRDAFFIGGALVVVMGLGGMGLVRRRNRRSQV